MITPVVDFSWLAKRHGDALVIDTRWYLDGRSGLDAYIQGHIPGAMYVDLDKWLAGKASPALGRHPLPDPAVFAEGMSQAGVSDGDVVVVYDDAGGVIAARLVWMLRVLGEDAALLDGGLQKFSGTLRAGAESRPIGHFSTRPWPASRIADIDETSEPGKIVLDARNRDRYRGENDPVDPRAGHIPGAVNVPCRENLNPDGTLLPIEILRQRFVDAGVVEGADVISYCGSGVTACHNLLTLEYVGLQQGRLFPGSWSQYSHALDRSVATGSNPG